MGCCGGDGDCHTKPQEGGAPSPQPKALPRQERKSTPEGSTALSEISQTRAQMRYDFTYMKYLELSNS